MIGIVLLIVALSGLSWFLIGRIGDWARRRAVLDVPDGRKQHDRPTPTGGGLAVAALCLGGLAGAGACGLVSLDRRIVGYLAAALLVASVSWIDDLRPLSSRFRLFVHVAAAVLVLAVATPWNRIDLPVLGAWHLSHWGLAVGFVWLVGLTNAYNFIDGLDGLAGTGAALAAGGWLVVAWLTGQPAVGLLAMLLLASTAGFLVHNWPPARIFMGDVGSTFCGFSLAAMGLLAADAEPRLAVTAVLFVWPFVFDAGLTFLRRVVRRENVFLPHRTHLYQRLAATGWPARRIVLLYGGLTLIGLVLGIGFALEPGFGWPAILVPPICACGLWRLVRWRENAWREKLAATDILGGPAAAGRGEHEGVGERGGSGGARSTRPTLRVGR